MKPLEFCKDAICTIDEMIATPPNGASCNDDSISTHAGIKNYFDLPRLPTPSQSLYFIPITFAGYKML